LLFRLITGVFVVAPAPCSLVAVSDLAFPELTMIHSRADRCITE